MGDLYAKDGRIYCSNYMEIYIPMSYFDNGIAVNNGSSIETLGLVYCRVFKDGEPGDIKLMNIPTIISYMSYQTSNAVIQISPYKRIEVFVLQYLKDSYILHQTFPKGRDVAYAFLNMMLGGKVPDSLNYNKVLNVWWRNLKMSGVSYKVPSKIYEMIIASIYRNPNNLKQRYGQIYGRSSNPNGFDYKTGDVRFVAKNSSTFTGFVFEDIGNMISNGINNTIENVEEPISPLEKIIHY